eukprot:590206-Pleurochrysis_carterae.AAC.1
MAVAVMAAVTAVVEQEVVKVEGWEGARVAETAEEDQVVVMEEVMEKVGLRAVNVVAFWEESGGELLGLEAETTAAAEREVWEEGSAAETAAAREEEAVAGEESVEAMADRRVDTMAAVAAGDLEMVEWMAEYVVGTSEMAEADEVVSGGAEVERVVVAALAEKRFGAIRSDPAGKSSHGNRVCDGLFVKLTTPSVYNDGILICSAQFATPCATLLAVHLRYTPELIIGTPISPRCPAGAAFPTRFGPQVRSVRTHSLQPLSRRKLNDDKKQECLKDGMKRRRQSRAPRTLCDANWHDDRCRRARDGRHRAA